MSPEELAKKHCYNGHDPATCELLTDVKALVSDERNRVAIFLESAATAAGEAMIAPKVITDMATSIRKGV